MDFGHEDTGEYMITSENRFVTGGEITPTGEESPLFKVEHNLSGENSIKDWILYTNNKLLLSNENKISQNLANTIYNEANPGKEINLETFNKLILKAMGGINDMTILTPLWELARKIK